MSTLGHHDRVFAPAAKAVHPSMLAAHIADFPLEFHNDMANGRPFQSSYPQYTHVPPMDGDYSKVTATISEPLKPTKVDVAFNGVKQSSIFGMT